MDIERDAGVAKQTDRMQQVVDQHRLVDIEFKVSTGCCKAYGRIVAKDLDADHGPKPSHWVGLTFPGMIELPGSFSGILISPMPQRGPLANHRTSLAIFMRATAKVLRPPDVAAKASWPAKLGKFVGGGDERVARQRRHLLSKALGKLRRGIEPSADGSAALGEGAKAWGCSHDGLPGQLELSGMARNGLAQSQRRCVLQVGAANFDQVGILLGLGFKRFFAVAQQPGPNALPLAGLRQCAWRSGRRRWTIATC